MRKTAISQLLRPAKGVVLGVVLGGAVGTVYWIAAVQTDMWWMRPPLFKECEQIKNEIYAKYLIDGRLPAPSEPAPSAQTALAAHPEIQYSTTKGLSYNFGKPYPVNVPLTGLLTFGLCWGGERGCSGEELPPESLIHNAKLWAPTSKEVRR
jgi:hypothetical protein